MRYFKCTKNEKLIAFGFFNFEGDVLRYVQELGKGVKLHEITENEYNILKRSRKVTIFKNGFDESQWFSYT